MGDGHGGIDKVASLWTRRGWSPPWTREIVTLHGLKSPSTWTYDSTTYRNHAKNSPRLHFVRTLQFPSIYILVLACFTLSATHTLAMRVYNVLCAH